jgi:hypothetical protein
MVATGYTISGFTSNVEVIDLEISSSSCKNLKDYPLKLEKASIGLLLDDSPLICGGYDSLTSSDTNNCFNLQNNEWMFSNPLAEAKGSFSISKHPFLKENFSLIETGGYKNSVGRINTTAILTNDGWKPLPPGLPKPEYGHCTIQFNSKILMSILVKETYFMSSTETGWATGPSLITARRDFGCGRIMSNAQSNTFSVIVAGGENGGASVEVLDETSGNWRAGANVINIFEA